jgi:hypothetical protein
MCARTRAIAWTLPHCTTVGRAGVQHTDAASSFLYVFGPPATMELAVAAANLVEELHAAELVNALADEVLKKFVGGLLRSRAAVQAASGDSDGNSHDLLGTLLYFSKLWRDVTASAAAATAAATAGTAAAIAAAASTTPAAAGRDMRGRK